MFRVLVLSLALCLFVPAVVMPECAAAADGKILDSTIDRYMQEASQWEPRIKEAARSMFWILATISLVFTFAYMIIRGNASFGDFFGEFLRFSITTGVFYWFLENGSQMAQAIIQSFGQLGMEASSSYQADLSPSNLISFAIDLVVRACSSFSEQGIGTGIVALLLSIAIAILFAIIAAMMVILLCSAWVLVYAGIIYLGFGGGRWTSDIAINYFKTVLGLAVQTFTFCLLVGIGQAQVERLIGEATQSKSVTVQGFVRTSTITTTAVTLTDACIILIFTVILFMLVKTVPNLIAGVINGSSVGGVQLGGFGSAPAVAAAGMAGGAMIVSQMSGAGLALRSAYQYALQHRDTGPGDLAKSGGIAGGLSGAMSKGLSFAENMAHSLASGAGSSAKDSLQHTTVGGKVSANIDAKKEREHFEKEKAQSAQDAGSETAAPETIAAETGGGNEHDSDAGGGGFISDSSASASLQQDTARGVSQPIPEPLSREEKEWRDALAKYDPKTVGRPDDE